MTERWKLVQAEKGWVELRFPDAPRGTRVHLRFGRRPSGRQVVEELRVLAGDGVQAGLLRKIPIGQIEEVVNTSPVRLRGQSVGVSVTTPAGLKVPVGPRDDTFYEQLAKAYADAVKIERRHPAQLLAEASGVSVRTVSRWLAEARRRGLIGPAT